MSELNEDELTPNTLIEIQENLALNNKMLIIKFSGNGVHLVEKSKI